MNLHEHQLISSVFDRMRVMSPVFKDGDAEATILAGFRSVPDAPYLLVQSVLLQEQSLHKAEARIRELEDIIRRLQDAPANSALGSNDQTFLRGAAGSSPLSNTAVPITQPRPPSSPWTVSQGGVAAPSPSPPSQAVGFLSSALATASSVAGGMLLAEGIRSMLGGNSMRQGLSESDSKNELQDARNDTDQARKALAEDDRAWDEEEDMADLVVADGDTAETSDA